jgi:DNA polymerase-3 subunit gamma/tau
MAYQSLYRKYRSQRFADVVGQAHVVAAVRNAVRDGRVGHAYLFSGPRGTGKTTIARLLAKALNCTNRADDGDACGVCVNCVGIAEGRFLDLFELDAASNNGVEAMRDLTESVHLGLGPASSAKVYLIDEVHMLSAGASNALLKTLEEPPDHVVFVLATTGPEKVLPTIRSRTQHYEFTLLSLDEIVQHLAWVCEQEAVAADTGALEILARAAAGSMRDALSLLDQAIAHGTLGVDEVASLFGGTGFERRMVVLDAIADEDPAGALVAAGDLLDAGFDPRRITEDLLATARDAFLLTTAKGRVRVELADDQLARLAALGDQTGPGLLVRTLETLGQAIVDMRGTDAADPRLVLEIALVRLCRRDAGPPLQALADRVERLERTVGQPGAAVADEPPPRRARGAPTRTIGAVRRERAARPATEADAAPDPDEPPPPTVDDPEPQASDSEPSAGDIGPVATVDNQAVDNHVDNQAVDIEPVDIETVDSEPVDIEPVDIDPVDIDEVILAWSELLTTLPPATRAAAQEAQPLSIADNVITFGVAPNMLANARPRFQKEADTIRDALSTRVGRRMKFKLVAHDGFAAPPTSRSTAPRTPPGDEQLAAPPDDEEIDITDLVDADADGTAVDSVSIIAKRLDATVVEERPRA